MLETPSSLATDKASSRLIQSHDTPIISEPDETSFWPNHPRSLDHEWTHYAWKLVLFLPLVLTWVVFIVLAAFVNQLNGKPISDHREAVREAIGVASTLWPIALAAVIGALLRALALFQAERGTRLGTLAVLLGSQTLVNTIKTAFNLRILSPCTVLLATLWAFSPLGGQAVLRSVRITPHIRTGNYKILYSPAASIGLPLNNAVWESSSERGYQLGKIYPMFGAALSAPNALAQASNGSSPIFDTVVQQTVGVGIASTEARVDLWGNVRVPEITALPGYSSESPHEWIEVPSDQLVTYESLIGIPIRGMPSRTAGNISFQLSATYLNLECSDWFNTTEWLSRIPNGLRMHSLMNISIVTENLLDRQSFGVSHTYMDTPNHSMQSNFNFSSKDRYSRGPLEHGTLVFGTKDNSTICDLSHVHIDAGVKCERPKDFETLNCHTHRVRHSPGHKILTLDTQMTPDDNGPAPGAFLAGLPWLASAYHTGEKSPFENYLADPARGIEDDRTSSYGITNEYIKLPVKVFAQRLALVINTAMRVSYYTPAVLGFDRVNLTEMETSLHKYGTTAGIFTTSDEEYEVQRAWMTIYIFSLCLMGICLLVTILLSLGEKSPDFLSSISALTRDSVHIKVPPGGSTLDGDERARVLKNRRLKIRDVQLQDEVGYIALADDKGHGDKEGLVMKNRAYA